MKRLSPKEKYQLACEVFPYCSNESFFQRFLSTIKSLSKNLSKKNKRKLLKLLK